MPLVRSKNFPGNIFPNSCNIPSSIKRKKFITHIENNCNMTVLYVSDVLITLIEMNDNMLIHRVYRPAGTVVYIM